MKEMKNRFLELDLWRAIAVLGMIIFHIIFFLNYFSVMPFTYYEGGWHVLARTVQWSFLLLVGIGIHLSFQKAQKQKFSYSKFLIKQLKRGLIVLFCGMLVTFFSYLFAPEIYIRFGILHFIGTSIIILSILADQPFLSLFMGFIFYGLSFWTRSTVVSFPWLLIFGFQVPDFSSLDYFPLFPWLAIPSFGIFLGSLLYKNFERRFSMPNSLQESKGLILFSILGKKSLIIYLLHGPIIIALVQFLMFMNK